MTCLRRLHRPALLALVLCAGLVACPTADSNDDDLANDDDTVANDDDTPIGPPEELFSFVIIADPHVAGPPEHETRLQAAVDWVNANAEAESIELVLILGDICWGSRLAAGEQLLQGLEVPWVPIIGDNVLHSAGGDVSFADTFQPQMDALASQLDGWEQAPWPILDDRLGGDAWMQNLRFEHRGVLFVGLDWNIRHLTGNLAEFGDFNDIPGGTHEWLASQLEGEEERLDESVLLLSHVPMLPGTFTIAEREEFATLIEPVKDKVFANLAGHLHVDIFDEDFDAGYETWVTDATWDDTNLIRIVRVLGNDVERAYEREAIVLD
ncbi:MAG: metallophosphoesterase [Deltaproteobacteria bacterium]|nr:metallophosphoesterase [Deltaproteobacteria bacterium]